MEGHLGANFKRDSRKDCQESAIKCRKQKIALKRLLMELEYPFFDSIEESENADRIDQEIKEVLAGPGRLRAIGWILNQHKPQLIGHFAKVATEEKGIDLHTRSGKLFLLSEVCSFLGLCDSGSVDIIVGEKPSLESNLKFLIDFMEVILHSREGKQTGSQLNYARKIMSESLIVEADDVFSKQCQLFSQTLIKEFKQISGSSGHERPCSSQDLEGIRNKIARRVEDLDLRIDSKFELGKMYSNSSWTFIDDAPDTSGKLLDLERFCERIQSSDSNIMNQPDLPYSSAGNYVKAVDAKREECNTSIAAFEKFRRLGSFFTFDDSLSNIQTFNPKHTKINVDAASSVFKNATLRHDLP